MYVSVRRRQFSVNDVEKSYAQIETINGPVTTITRVRTTPVEIGLKKRGEGGWRGNAYRRLCTCTTRVVVGPVRAYGTRNTDGTRKGFFLSKIHGCRTKKERRGARPSEPIEWIADPESR